jgi:drug/metabolite transporter (DMT)-like permease
MRASRLAARPSAETAGLWFGLLGVLSFSLTFPATRVAVAYLDPSVVGLGRALLAAVLAALLLAATRQRRPTRAELGSLAIVIAGVIFGFPFLSAWALRSVPSAHGAIVIGLLPLATACVATFRNGERPSWQFWLAGVAGSAAVIGFSLATGSGGLELADLALLAAVVAGAFGYAEGARLARTLGSWQVICWALVLAAPLLSVPVGLAIWQHGLAAPPSAWLGLLYVAVVSQFLGFFAWYRGLALGGVARVSQIQLLQPFLTLLASALLLHEQITPATLLVALVVLLSVALGRRAVIARVPVKAVYNEGHSPGNG